MFSICVTLCFLSVPDDLKENKRIQEEIKDLSHNITDELKSKYSLSLLSVSQLCT